MELLNLMRSRKSIRTYANKYILQEHLNIILEAASLAPTSHNRKPCKYIAVTDRSILDRLSRVKTANAIFTSQAGAAIVVAADSEISDIWIEDSSIALTYMLLAAEALGLGCCWVQIRLRFTEDGVSAEERVREILGLPKRFRIVGFITIGVKT